jgi:hypothetical protein
MVQGRVGALDGPGGQGKEGNHSIAGRFELRREHGGAIGGDRRHNCEIEVNNKVDGMTYLIDRTGANQLGRG